MLFVIVDMLYGMTSRIFSTYLRAPISLTRAGKDSQGKRRCDIIGWNAWHLQALQWQRKRQIIFSILPPIFKLCRQIYVGVDTDCSLIGYSAPLRIWRAPRVPRVWSRNAPSKPWNFTCAFAPSDPRIYACMCTIRVICAWTDMVTMLLCSWRIRKLRHKLVFTVILRSKEEDKKNLCSDET